MKAYRRNKSQCGHSPSSNYWLTIESAASNQLNRRRDTPRKSEYRKGADVCVENGEANNTMERDKVRWRWRGDCTGHRCKWRHRSSMNWIVRQRKAHEPFSHLSAMKETYILHHNNGLCLHLVRYFMSGHRTAWHLKTPGQCGGALPTTLWLESVGTKALSSPIFFAFLHARLQTMIPRLQERGEWTTIVSQRREDLWWDNSSFVAWFSPHLKKMKPRRSSQCRTGIL